MDEPDHSTPPLRDGDPAAGRRGLAVIRAATWEELRDLQRVHDLDVVDHSARRRADGGFELDAVVSPEEIGRLRALGYVIEPRDDPKAG
jgi:hypothetical protein